jgi:hypothetical protein
MLVVLLQIGEFDLTEIIDEAVNVQVKSLCGCLRLLMIAK